MTSEEKDRYIREHYLTTPAKRIARELGVSGTQVRGRMKRMGLVVPPEIIAKFRKESQFQKGNPAHNKGVPIDKWMPKESQERMKATQFKKGQLPHNTNNPGDDISIRMVHGTPYVFKRIRIGKWDFLHRMIWREAHGEIPEGSIVIFRDGNPLNVCIDNLQLVPREEHMKWNSHRIKKWNKEKATAAIRAVRRKLIKINYNYGTKQTERSE